MPLKFLTYNAGLLKIGLFGKTILEPAPYVEERFRHLAPALLDCGADIIALQEVYDRRHQEGLSAALSAEYPYQAVSPTRAFRPLGSALMLFSKHPIESVEHPRFSHIPFDEQLFVDKGMIIANVRVAGLGTVRLANAHHTSGGALWHPEGWLAKRARRRQYEELFEILNGDRADHRLALGDFNAGPEATTENYLHLLSYGYADAWSLCRGQGSRPTWEACNPLNVRGPHCRTSSQRLDHVLLGPSMTEAVRVAAADVVFNEPQVELPDGRRVTISDHYGLSIDLELK